MNNAAKLKPVTGEDCENLEVYNRFHTPTERERTHRERTQKAQRAQREKELTERESRENAQRENAHAHTEISHTERTHREKMKMRTHTHREQRESCSPTVTLVTVTGLTSFHCARRHGVSGVTTLNFIIINFRPHTHTRNTRVHTHTDYTCIHNTV